MQNMLMLFNKYKEIIFITIAAYLVYLVAKYILNKLKPLPVTKSDIKEIEQETGETQTYKDSQYKQFADAIFEVMDKSAIDEAPNKVLYDVVEQLRNQIDWLKLVQAYGTRQLRWFGLPDGKPKNLVQALASEDHLNKVRSILAGKGIAI